MAWKCFWILPRWPIWERSHFNWKQLPTNSSLMREILQTMLKYGDHLDMIPLDKWLKRQTLPHLLEANWAEGKTQKHPNILKKGAFIPKIFRGWRINSRFCCMLELFRFTSFYFASWTVSHPESLSQQASCRPSKWTCLQTANYEGRTPHPKKVANA